MPWYLKRISFAFTLLCLLSFAACSGGKERMSADAEGFIGRKPNVKGYFKRPGDIKVKINSGKLTIQAPIGSIVANSIALTDLHLGVWNTNMEMLKAISKGAAAEVQVTQGSPIGNLAVSADGSIDFAGDVSSIDALLLFLSVEKDSSMVPIPNDIAFSTAAFQTRFQEGTPFSLNSVFDLGGFTPPSGKMFAGVGIWTSPNEVSNFPTSGPEWDWLKQNAETAIGTPDLKNINTRDNVYTLARGIAFARTKNETYRQEAISAIQNVIGTETGGDSLVLGRKLAGYVMAADLVELSSTDQSNFKSFLQSVVNETMSSGYTLKSAHETRPNSQGLYAGASRAAIAAYLGDRTELDRIYTVFRGWLGDRSSYSGFTFGSLTWQSDPLNPVGINPAGALISGHSVDGALPDNLRADCSFQWPVCSPDSAWDGLQGAVTLAEILYRQGYPVYQLQDEALLRAARFFYVTTSYSDVGRDEEWIPWILDRRYGTSYASMRQPRNGKIMGFTSFTHPH